MVAEAWLHRQLAVNDADLRLGHHRLQDVSCLHFLTGPQVDCQALLAAAGAGTSHQAAAAAAVVQGLQGSHL